MGTFEESRSMKYVLIVFALRAGSEVPSFEHRTFADKAQCHAIAKRYVEQSRGRSEHRAFCLKVRT